MRPERQAIRSQNFEQPKQPRAQDDAKQSATKRQQDRFHHHLSHHMPSARAHRLADRHFFRAVARADEKEVHEVHRADEQEEKHAGLHQPKCRADGADVIGMERNHR